MDVIGTNRTAVAEVVDFACLVALDPAISARVIRDALIIADNEALTAPTIRRLVMLSHARAEAWRQLRARGIHPDTAPVVRLDAEPLEALTPAERAVLHLALRLELQPADIAFITELTPRNIKRTRRAAIIAFKSAVTALALALDPTPCPVRDSVVARGGGMLQRADIRRLTSHAAECSICIDLLRRAEKQSIDRYRTSIRPTDVEIDVVISDLRQVEERERRSTIERAGKLRSDGRPPRGDRFDADPRIWLRRAIGFGIASVVLILSALMLGAF